jgi:hypothetical protein
LLMINIWATGGLILTMTLQLFATLVLGLMRGSELRVAAFAHPALKRQPLDLHIPMRSSLIGGAVGPCDAVLDGGLYPVEFSPAITVRTSEPVGVGAGRNGFGDSSDRCPVFACRSGAHQQADCKVDAGIASFRLERAGTSLGSV